MFGDGHRVFFLSAGLYAVFAGLVWAIWLFAQGTGQSGMVVGSFDVISPNMWHAHEMVFGYAGAAMGGFFLTAVPSWTNSLQARRIYLIVAFVLWLGGRMSVLYIGVVQPVVVAFVDLAFVPFLTLKIVTQLSKRPKPQNVMFLAILILIWGANLSVHLEWTGVVSDGAGRGVRAGILALGTMVAVLGGRITPAFTRNAMKREEVDESRWPASVRALDGGSLVLGAVLTLAVLFGAPNEAIGMGAIVFAGIQAVRLARWRGLWARHQPILFALHLAIGMLVPGFFLWGLAAFGIGDEIAALHILGIGAIGGMTLAIMSRAALSHVGLPIVAPRAMVWSYGLIAGLAILRWGIGVFAPAGYFTLMAGISMGWVVAFALYLLAMGPALVQSRQKKSDK